MLRVGHYVWPAFKHLSADRGSWTSMESAPCSHLWIEDAEAGAGAMLVGCRLPGLSALGAHYAGVKWRAMNGPPPPWRLFTLALRVRVWGGFVSAGVI
jgi:hypothetical protein